jgi:hypothetical protein
MDCVLEFRCYCATPITHQVQKTINKEREQVKYDEEKNNIIYEIKLITMILNVL